MDAPYDFEDTDWVNVFGEPSPEMAKIEDDNLQQDVSRQMEMLNKDTSSITQPEERLISDERIPHPSTVGLSIKNIS